MAGVIVVGGGFLIEKLNDAGRAFLSGYQVPLESLALVDINPSGQVRVLDADEPRTKAQQQQEELDLLLDVQQQQDELGSLIDENGRINLDFTVDSAPTEEMVKAAAAEEEEEVKAEANADIGEE